MGLSSKIKFVSIVVNKKFRLVSVCRVVIKNGIKISEFTNKAMFITNGNKIFIFSSLNYELHSEMLIKIIERLNILLLYPWSWLQMSLPLFTKESTVGCIVWGTK